MKNSTELNSYISTLIVSLQIDIDIFMLHLDRGDNYETIIYHWATNLYEEKTPIDIAIQKIHKKRIQWLNTCTENFINIEKGKQRTSKKVMERLQFHPLYIESVSKKNIQQRVDSLVATQLYSSIQVEKMILAMLRDQQKQHNNPNPPDTSSSGNISFLMLAKSMIAELKTIANVF